MFVVLNKNSKLQIRINAYTLILEKDFEIYVKVIYYICDIVLRIIVFN